MRSVLKDKRGVLGMDTVKAFLGTILVVAVLAMAVLITLDSLDDTSVATDSTKNISANISEGISSFWENAPTFFTLLAVAVIILVIALVIVAVNRFGGSSTTL